MFGQASCNINRAVERALFSHCFTQCRAKCDVAKRNGRLYGGVIPVALNIHRAIYAAFYIGVQIAQVWQLQRNQCIDVLLIKDLPDCGDFIVFQLRSQVTYHNVAIG